MRFLTSVLILSLFGVTIFGAAPAFAAKTAYEVLELHPRGVDVSHDDIKAAYRRLSKKYHPNAGAATANAEKFRELQEAYDKIKTEELRAVYDRHGSRPPPPNGSPIDVKKFDQIMDDMVEAGKIRGQGDPLLTVFFTFYLTDGTRISADLVAHVADEQNFTGYVGEALRTRYLNKFLTLGSSLWFVGESTDSVRWFNRDWAHTESFAEGIVNQMMTLTSFAEEQEQHAMWTHVIHDGNKRDEKVIKDLLLAVPNICSKDLKACVLDLADGISSRAPRIFRTLNTENTQILISLIDQVTEQQPKNWLFSEEYIALHKFRAQMVGRNSGTFYRALECVRILSTHATQKALDKVPQ